MTSPDKNNPGEQALAHALRLLRHRARSRQELQLALSRKGFPGDVAEATLARLVELGYVDDARFARGRATALLEKGRLGEASVRQRLLAHGLSGDAADTALREAMAEVGFDALAAGQRQLERRGLWGRPLAEREQAQAARFLSARGFSEEQVEELLRRASALESPR